MSRLYDRMIARGEASHPLDTVISGDNVAQYYYEHHWETTEDVSDLCPNVAPPLEAFFVDFRTSAAPAAARMPVDQRLPWWPGGTPQQEPPYAWGVEFTSFPIDDDERNAMQPAANADAPHQEKDLQEYIQDIIDDIRWQIYYRVFIELDKQVPAFCPWAGRILAFADGSIYRNRAKGSDGLAIVGGQLTPVGAHLLWPTTLEDYGDAWKHESEPDGAYFRALHMMFTYRYLAPALLTVSFMHCKNVVQRVERPPDWAQKAAQKKHKPPLVSYRVLEIEPMKRVLRTEGGIEHNGLPKALHICRGHFATYDDKPLFGKVRGTFWRPSHVRGSLEHGAVVKDYAVKQPQA